MQHLFFFLFVFVTASLFALLEIQIEGPHGWAEKLPTWRIKPKSKGFLRLFAAPEKPITGYHIYTWILYFIILHIIFFFTQWSFYKELFIVAYYSFFLSLEDFLYFIYSPYWGLKKFNKENIKWHTIWFLGLHLQYWFKFPLALILYWLATRGL